MADKRNHRTSPTNNLIEEDRKFTVSCVGAWVECEEGYMNSDWEVKVF